MVGQVEVDNLLGVDTCDCRYLGGLTCVADEDRYVTGKRICLNPVRSSTTGAIPVAAMAWYVSCRPARPGRPVRWSRPIDADSTAMRRVSRWSSSPTASACSSSATVIAAMTMKAVAGNVRLQNDRKHAPKRGGHTGDVIRTHMAVEVMRLQVTARAGPRHRLTSDRW